MNDMERRKFEDSFQDAFKDAEVNPSENVWTNIELDLEKAQGDKMKRRLLFFQTLAAASIAFAMCIAGIGYYVMNHDVPGNLAHQSTNPGNSIREDQASNNGVSNTIRDTNEDTVTSSDNKNANAVTPSAKNDAESSSPVKSDDLQNGNEAAKEQATASVKSSRDNNAIAAKEDGNTESNKAQNSTEHLQKKSGDTKKAAPLIAASKTNASKTPNVTTAKSSPATLSKVDGKEVNSVVSGAGQSNEMGLTQQNSRKSMAATNLENPVSERKLPLLYQPQNPELQLAASTENVTSTIDPGMKLLLDREEEIRRYAQEDKKLAKTNSEKLWTSVGFAAGGFNANNPTVGGAPTNAMYAMNSSQTASQQSKANGVSYSVGVGFGTKLSERWVLQGGLSYLTQSSDYTANGVVVVGNNYADPQAASLNAFAPQLRDESADTKVATTFPYNVNNNVRFVSIPVQAGYLLVNRKFGLQLNAGVGTDLFLQNTITPDGAGLTKTTQGRGDESPYRSLNFSGLVGTEFSYRLGYHYRLSLNPGIRYPFSSVYKSNTGVDSNPVTFDLGLRFKYIFH